MLSLVDRGSIFAIGPQKSFLVWVCGAQDPMQMGQFHPKMLCCLRDLLTYIIINPYISTPPPVPSQIAGSQRPGRFAVIVARAGMPGVNSDQAEGLDAEESHSASSDLNDWYCHWLPKVRMLSYVIYAALCMLYAWLGQAEKRTAWPWLWNLRPKQQARVGHKYDVWSRSVTVAISWSLWGMKGGRNHGKR